MPQVTASCLFYYLTCMNPIKCFVVCLLLVNTAPAQPRSITVYADQKKATVSRNMWGVFFEDINLAADGGVYAEMVKNRSFEFTNPLMGWREIRKDAADGSVWILNRGAGSVSNPRYAHVKHTSDAQYGIRNEGFRGMGVLKDSTYDFSVWAQWPQGSAVKLHIQLRNKKDEVLGNAVIPSGSTQWKKYTASFHAADSAYNAHLVVWFEGKGEVNLDMISLFPRHTWKRRPGGLRADLVQLLADMKPGFLRFPGGCIVEGRDLANRYQWKKTVGKVEERELIINRWNTEFANRSTPDYFQSFGLGFYEYFLLAEDIGAAPLPILNCGMACQYNTAELVPATQLDPYIQDALDLVEFANGATNTRWGALRAAMGHPSPFNLRMIGVGNEQWGPQYIERYTLFAKQLKKKYPYLQLVSSAGPSPDGKLFDFATDTLKKLKADLVDEHYYKPPEWFLQQTKRYDMYDRKAPSIFAGEYASHVNGIPNGPGKNNWRAALSEAAFMTGLERNADIVKMASYAPLFAHVEGWQWSPNLIWFDNLRSYGTPSYYVQQLFANYRGDYTVPVLSNGAVIAGNDSLYASAVVDERSKEIIVKIANTVSLPQLIQVQLQGIGNGEKEAILTLLKGKDLNAVNDFNHPDAVSPVTEKSIVRNGMLTWNAPANSFVVIRIRKG
jgi:alpha-N-arabinofuranosidase